VVKHLTQFATANVVGVTKCRTHNIDGSHKHVYMFWTENLSKRNNLRGWGTDGRKTVTGSCINRMYECGLEPSGQNRVWWSVVVGLVIKHLN